MATRLAAAIEPVPGVQILHPVEANAVFALLPAWNERTGEVRLMTSFDTTESDVDAFAAAQVAQTRRG